MKAIQTLLIIGLTFQIHCLEATEKHEPTATDIQMAEKIARDVAKWFTYTTDKMHDEHMGQCSDYALMFILKYNEYLGSNVARLVTTNNPVPSGTYFVGDKVDVKKLGFNGFESGASGFMIWDDQLYLYHPILGAYKLTLEKAWVPKKHFGVNMLDKRQVHCWARIGEVSVDPTYIDCFPDSFPSPLGKDE